MVSKLSSVLSHLFRLTSVFMADVLVLTIVGSKVVFYEIKLLSVLLREYCLFFTLNKCNFREIPHLAWEQKGTFSWQLIIIIIIKI